MARRRSSTSISATRPVFPGYLLPSFDFVFHHRRSTSVSSSASSASPTKSPISTAETTPANSPPGHEPIIKGSSFGNFFARRLSRNAPDILRCTTCSTNLALASQIISKGFTGRYGRAFLVAPPGSTKDSLLNIRIGRSEDRQLVTGWHVVADICCATCGRKLGWKYVDAKEQSQKYKVGKYILETERVMTHRSWDDYAVEDLGLIDEEEGGSDVGARRSLQDSDEIVFDSDDEEECEDIFAGTWDAATVAKRRSESTARGISLLG
ncbi:hypothetical protein QQS21_007892 [Conoideocrella luteorostrata]|uniref:Yippee domain-containing protein n=1 Tax=Conoideocrella luteorostrata TaxID=1105319 RepID=A0AAJ0FRN6_9HYPO|nr:hypothetical protein QQS21_007892 [Conoideocrella luteorostrata]